MTSKSSKVRIKAFGLAILVAITVVLATRPVAEQFDRLYFDYIIRMHGGGDVRDDFVFLGIDEASLNLQGLSEEEISESYTLQSMSMRLPWDRGVWADAITRLGDAGARLIVIDLIFSSPSDPDADAELAEAINKYRDKVVLTSAYSPVGLGPNGNFQYTLIEPLESFVFGDDVEAETKVGYSNFPAHPLDGKRRVARYQSSLGLENGEMLEGEPMQTSLAGCIVEILGGELPDVDREILFSSNEHGDGTGIYAPVSLYGIFVDDIWEKNYANGDFFKDKVIMIGPAAHRLQDIHPTPVGMLSGPQLHLQAAGAALSGAYLYPFSYPWWMISVFGGLTAFWASLGKRASVSALVAAAILVAFVLGSVGLLLVYGLQVPVMGTGLAIIFAWITGQTYHYVVDRRERLRLRAQFRRFVSKDVADSLVDDPERWTRLAAGESRRVVVMFSDVRGFTSRSESEPPERLVSQLNEYLTAMVDVVFQNGGTLDKFIGDAVMAHWGALGEGTPEEHAKSALQTARWMLMELDKLNTKWQAQGQLPMHIGIGLHIGEVIAGELGSPERIEFGIIGDAVNLASRIEGLTKTFSAELIYSGELREAAGDDEGIALGAIRVKGRSEPVLLYAEGDDELIKQRSDEMERDSDGVITMNEK